MAVAPYPPLDGTQPCATTDDPDLFFSDDPYSVPTAVALCRQCPFIRPCLAFALTHVVDGVWGGTTQPQRRRVQRANNIQPQPLHLVRSETA